MATIPNQNLDKLRQKFVKGRNPNYAKSTLNAAFQAIEDRIESSKSVINNDIDTATAPYVFSPAEKVEIVRLALEDKFKRGG